MSEASILGGLGTALCLSFIWPYCFQKQWGAKGLLRTCPCCATIPCVRILCSSSSGTVCDCGWMGENDHAYFGTDEERAEEEARERAMRTAWANRIVRDRERQRIMGVVGGVKGGVGVLGERFQGVGGLVGQRVHGVRDRIPLNFFGHGVASPAAIPTNASPGTIEAVAHGIAEDLDKGFDTGIYTEGVGGMNAAKRKSIIQGVDERNLDDIIGGSRLRAQRPDSVLYDGAPGVESTASVRRREGSGVGRSGSGSGVGRQGSGVARSGSAATRSRTVAPSKDDEALVLNRGTIANQTVVQRQYGPTAPMTIASSLPHDDYADAPPTYK